MKRVRALALGAGVIAILSPGLAQASYPAGVWVKVQAVQYEPSAAAPTRIRITGAAMLYDGSDGGTSYFGYTEPERGVLYYECPAAQLSTCADEWNDIVANISAPPEVCVGLGDQSEPTGRLRPLGEAPGTADVYPIHMGILPGFSPCEVIRQFLSAPADGGSGAGGKGALGSGGTVGEGSGGAPAMGGAAGAGAVGPAGQSGNGGSGAGAGGTAPVVDASTGPGPAPAAPRSAESSDGCSVGAGSTPALPSVGLALIALIALRRRRS